MSGPQGSDPGQQWQPPGEGVDRSRSQLRWATPWQQQPPGRRTRHGRPRPTRRPPGTRRTSSRLSRPTRSSTAAAARLYPQPEQYGSARPGTSTASPASTASPVSTASRANTVSPASTASRASPANTVSPANTRSSTGLRPTGQEAFVGADRRHRRRDRVAASIAVVLVLGFWEPGFFVTTKLDVNKAQSGVQQILTDETNGYGAKNVKNVKCNNGGDPTVKKGGTFDCDVSIDGASQARDGDLPGRQGHLRGRPAAVAVSAAARRALSAGGRSRIRRPVRSPARRCVAGRRRPAVVRRWASTA